MPKQKNSTRMFRDAWYPSNDEVLQWAYSPNVFVPVQDFELAVYRRELHDIILHCAADQACPNRYFFLSCLYVLVGDAVRTKWSAFSQPAVMRLIVHAQRAEDRDIQKWAERAEMLISEPTTYSYDQWGLGSSFVIELQRENQIVKKGKR